MTKNKRYPLAMLFAVALCPEITLGDLVISAPAFPVVPGSSGSFDVLLKSTGTETASIGSFTFDILAAIPGVTFTDAMTTTSAAPYIYAGNSFADINGLPLATKTGPELLASDAPNNGTATFITSSTPFALGEVFYSIAASTIPGPMAFTFSSAGTSLSDEFGNPLTFTTAITPEPAPLSLLIVGLGVFLAAASRRRARQFTLANHQ
jgi:hypothetical protein